MAGQKRKAGDVGLSSMQRMKRAHKLLTAPTKSALNNQIKRVVKGLFEKKSISTFGSVASMANAANTVSAPFTTNNVIQLSPCSTMFSMAQGVTQATRVGNAITPTKVEFHMAMFPNNYDATNNNVPIPQEVEICVFSLVAQDQSLTAAQNTCAAAGGGFFQNGASFSGFSGNLGDCQKLINTDLVKVFYRRRVKLGAANYQTNTGTQANSYSYSNNEYHLNQMVKIDLLKYGFPKKVTFLDNSVAATSRALFLVLSPCDADGGSNSSTTSAIPCIWQYTANMEYTDA